MTNRCESTDRPAHPIDILMAEHETITVALDAAEAELARIAAGAPFRPAFWRDYVDFMDNYADRCHHGKEEDVLFLALEELGLPRHSGPLRRMHQEHDAMGAERGRLRAAVENAAVPDVVEHATAGINLLREHMFKEDDVLFPMVRDLLRPAMVARLQLEFVAVENDLLGAGMHARYEAMVHRLGGEIDTTT